jgi:hypothetical protein
MIKQKIAINSSAEMTIAEYVSARLDVRECANSE